MDIINILFIVWLHTLTDFYFQSREVATNKGKNFKVLLRHVTEYSLPFLIMAAWLPVISVVMFVAVNFALHLLTDFISSKLTTKFYQANNMTGFWRVIGTDQAIHYTCLFTSFYWIFG
jgi:flagellar biosynthesis protein FlhB